MALPVSPGPKSDDVASHGWAGLTVRVAWTLLSCGVKLRPEVLDAARAHVLYHLPPSTPLARAEDRAEHLTRRFVATARGKEMVDPWPGDAEMPLADRWARAIHHLRDRATASVFRMHYGDRRSLAYVEGKLGVDRMTVDMARAGLREVLRRAAREDGLPLDAWPAERLDRVLARLASWAPDPCPPTYDVVNGAHLAHVQACPRCNRMVRLVHANKIDSRVLHPPTLRARPRGDLELLVLAFHPDGRRHRARLAEALSAPSHPVGDDLLLVDAGDPDAVFEVLRIAAELGRPERHHLRGARVAGKGEWTRFGPVGPTLERALHEVRGRPWGTVDGLGVLPEPLPKPPSARFAWLGTGLLAASALFAAWLAVAPATGATPEGQVSFVDGGAATWVQLDVPESTSVALVAAPGGTLEPVLSGASVSEKALYAVGDGTYRLQVPGEQVLVVTSPEPFELEPLLDSAGRAPDPLVALHMAVRRALPGARVFVRER